MSEHNYAFKGHKLASWTQLIVYDSFFTIFSIHHENYSLFWVLKLLAKLWDP